MAFTSFRMLQGTSSGAAPFDSTSTYASLLEIGQAMAATDNTSGVTENITTNVNSANVGNWDYRIVDGQTVSSFTSSDWFSGTADTRGTFITFKGNTTISTTFQPSDRKLWTVIYVDGDLNLSGSISMSLRGANHNNGPTSAANIRIAEGTYSSVTNPQIPSAGGSAGGGGSTGGTGTNGGTGGGAGGGGGGGAGAAGTSYTGGSGGGGRDGGGGGSAQTNGGAGGSGGGQRSGGGAGNPGSNGGSICSNYGCNGTGGVIVLFVTGTISGSGSLTASGTGGGGSCGGRGGGGTGGGSVTVLSATDSFTGSVTASGGGNNCGSYADQGAHGGAGTARKLTGL